MNSKLRGTVRGHNHNQSEKPSSKPEWLTTSESRAERPWGSHRQDSFISHPTQNGPMRSNSALNGPVNLAYGMYPLPAMNPGGVSSNGRTMPSVVMLYPYDHNARQPRKHDRSSAFISDCEFHRRLLREGNELSLQIL